AFLDSRRAESTGLWRRLVRKDEAGAYGAGGGACAGNRHRRGCPPNSRRPPFRRPTAFRLRASHGSCARVREREAACFISPEGRAARGPYTGISPPRDSLCRISVSVAQRPESGGLLLRHAGERRRFAP